MTVSILPTAMTLSRFLNWLRIIPAIVRKTYLPVVLATVVGIALSTTGLVNMLTREQEHRLTIFHRQAESRIAILETSISDALNHVNLLGNLFSSVPNIGRGNFQRFSKPVIENHTFLYALMWVPRVPDSLRRGYEQEARAKGFPQFGFREREPSGALIRSGARRVYHPVYFLEPIRGNRELLGFDLTTRPEYRQAMEKAAQSGALVATGRVTLPQEGQDGFGFMVLKAVYEGQAPGIPETGRRQVKGYVAGIFRIPRLMAGHERIALDPGILPHISLFDKDSPPVPQLLYRNASPITEISQIADYPHSTIGTVHVADRKWLAVIVPPEEVYSSTGSVWPFAVFAAGLTVTGFLGFYLHRLLARRFQVEDEVIQITAALSDTLAMVRESEERFRNLTEAVSDWLWETDEEGRFVLFSNRFQEFTGVEAKPFLGKTLQELEAQQDVPEFLLQVSREVQTQKAFRDLVGQYRDRAGELRIAKISGKPAKAQNGRFIGFQGVGTDLTHLHKAEQALAESRQHLQTVIDHAPLVMFAWNPEGQLTLAEGKALHEFGLIEDQWGGQKVEDVFKDIPELLNGYRRTLSGKSTTEKLDVNRVGFEFWLSPLTGKDQKTSGGLAVGLEATHKIYFQKMQTQFISAMSHELRTPLSSIIGYADLLLDEEAGQLTENQNRFLRVISENAARLTTLVRNLEGVKRMEGELRAWETEQVDLSRVLATVEANHKVLARHKGLAMEVRIDEGLTVVGDKERLSQAFNQLLTASVKSTPEGWVKLSAQFRDGKNVVVLCDSGEGMDIVSLAHLFERSYDLDNGAVRSTGDTGLGLAIAREILIAHQGSLDIKSEPGQGSEFTVVLPAPSGLNAPPSA